MERLPEFPPLPIVYKSEIEPYKSNTLIRHLMDERDAWSARCRLAVFALEHYSNATALGEQLVMDLKEGTHDMAAVATEALKAIGPLPEKQW